VAQLSLELPLEPRIARLLDAFSVEPGEADDFRTLEAHLSASEDWCRLAGVYECRLSVLDPEDSERGEILLGLARILDERLEDLAGARRCYEEALRATPARRDGLERLRQLHRRAGDLDAALEVAEIEDRIERPKPDRARWLVDVASIWEAKGEPRQAWRRVRDALKLDPGCGPAVELLAELAHAAGRTEESIRLLERRARGLEGSARADVLERIVDLQEGEPGNRALSLLREIVEVDPDRIRSLQRLVPLEEAEGNRDRVEALWQRLWRLLPDAAERAPLALRAAETHLEGGDLEAARTWITRGGELLPDSLAVAELRARLLRRTGQTRALIETLEILAEAENRSELARDSGCPEAPPLFLELAALYEQEGELNPAVEKLRRHLERQPGDEAALARLDGCLAQLDCPRDRGEVLETRLAFTREPGQRAQLFVELGALRAGTLDDAGGAEAAYRSALREDPDRWPALEGLEALLREQGRGEDLAHALDELTRQPAPAPSLARRWSRLGSVRLELLDDADGALHAFRHALEVDPGVQEALDGLRAVARIRRNPSLRIEACERELSAGADDARAAAALADGVEAAREAHDPIRASRLAASWVDRTGSVDALRALAHAAREAGSRSEEMRALVALEPLLQKSPEARCECFIRLGELELESPNPDALGLAATWFEEAICLSPDPELRSRLGEIYRRLGLLPELVRVLADGLEALPLIEAGARRVEIANALEQLGDREGAAAVLWEAWESAPETPGVAEALESILGDLDRLEEIIRLLGGQLERGLEPERRLSVAVRAATLLLDGLGRAEESASILRPHVQPSQSGPAETLFTRCLEATQAKGELERWLGARAREIDGAERGDVLLRLATLQEEAGRVDEALATLWQAERSAPLDRRDPIHRRLLAGLDSRGGPEVQLEILGRLLEGAEPGQARTDLQLERAQILHALDRTAEARSELESAIAEGSVPIPALAMLAELYRNEGHAEDQIRTLRALLRRDPEPPARRGATLELAAVLAEGSPPVRDVEEAEGLLRGLLSEDPEDPEPFRRLANLLEVAERFDALAELLRERLRAESPTPDERVSVGLRLARLEPPPDAVGRLRALREEFGPQGAVDRALSDALRAARDWASELTLSRVCVEHAPPGTAERREWLGRWSAALEREAPDPAARLEQVRALLELCPDEAALLRAHVNLLRQTGADDALAAAIEAALEKPGVWSGSSRQRAVRELVLLYEQNLEAPRRALDRVERELTADPTLAPLAVRLASRIDDPEREQRILEALVIDPPSGFDPQPAHLRRVALGLFGAKRIDEAEPLLLRSVAAQPQDLTVVRALDSLARTRSDGIARIRWLEARFALEPRPLRMAVARDAFALADAQANDGEALRWLRRWQSLEPLAEGLAYRWMELEREHGDRGGELRALQAALDQVDNPRVRARLTARRAELLEQAGERELARRAWREAVQADSDPDVDLLRAWESSLCSPEHTLERAEALARLAQQPAVPDDERTRFASDRAEILARIPETREQAASELRRLFERTTANAEERLRWGRALLRLYRAHDAEWCAVGERVVPLLSGEEKAGLMRALALKLGGPLGARDRAILWWERLLELVPDASEALRHLVDLLSAPGYETRRAPILERLAGLAPEDATSLLVEAARVRWRSMGDANAALADLNRVLAMDARLAEAHALRLEVCDRLDRPDEQAESLEALLADRTQGAEAADRWLRIARLFAQREDRRADARRAAEKALLVAPASTEIRPAVRLALEQAHDWDRVAVLLREEVRTASGPEALALERRLARIELEERGDATRSCEALEAVARTDTLTVEDLELYAESLTIEGRREEALAARAQLLERKGTVAPEDWLDLATARLEQLDDPHGARKACNAALRCDPYSVAAMRLLAILEARLGNAASEIACREALAAQLRDAAEASVELARAGTVARESLGDLPSARSLFQRALKGDDACVPALLGTGQFALEREDWAEAERCFARAYPLLSGMSFADRRGEAARLAARAAARLGRSREVLLHLETALAENPEDPETLDLGADASVQVGAFQKARGLLESRLSLGDLDAGGRAERLWRLARVCGELGEPLGAVPALAEAVSLRPQDERARARLVELLGELEQWEEAVAQLDGWIVHAHPDARAELALRAARIELQSGDRGRGLGRLERIVSEDPAQAGAWHEIASLTLEEHGPEEALRKTGEALRSISSPQDRATLLALQAVALGEQGRRTEAAQSALAAVELDPGDHAAALCLARHVGQVGDWRRGVRALERTLEVSHFAPAVEAELWEAIGRLYAGPLQNLERAERSYRCALNANPESDRAREALAEVTSFDPGAHTESLRLHRVLLEKFPARRASWRALERIAEHRRDATAAELCRWVRCALEGGEKDEHLCAEAHALLGAVRSSPEVEIGHGEWGLRETLVELLQRWPATAGLELQQIGDLAEVSQLCPPVRRLLLQIADAVTARLG
jgi:tetratricopeptide (TPR) repeat protein